MDFKKKSKNLFTSAKEKAEQKIKEVQEERIEEKEAKAEARREIAELRKIFKPKNKVGTLEIDNVNNLFRVKNATSDAYKKKKGIIGATVDVTVTAYTLGANKIVQHLTKPADRIFSFSEIIDFDLLEDDVSVASGGLGRALVGGIAFGVVGAAIGAATGPKTTKKKVSQLIIKINMKDYDMPCIMIPYITKPTKTSSKNYQEAFSEAQKVISYLNLMINETKDVNQEENVIGNIEKSSSDPIEELKKLKELVDMGILSQEEFDIKKKELLNL